MAGILVVDDDETFLTLTATLLKEQGHEVKTCKDPHKAVDILSADDGYQCVLLDYHMPKLDGQDLLRLIHSKFPKLPVLICSGYLDVNEADLIRDGAAALLHKPFDSPALLDTIKRTLAEEVVEEEMTQVQIRGYNLRESRELLNRKLIIKALTKSSFNVTHTAKLLGISRQYLMRYLKSNKINIPANR